MDRRLRFADSLLTVFAAPNTLGRARLGISIGRSSGGAVRRNRLKRLIREAWRRSYDRIPRGYDYVVLMTKKNQPSLPTYQQVQTSLTGLMAKLNPGQEQQ